jgi:hypothetical protein
MPIQYRESPRKASTDWPPRFMKVAPMPSDVLFATNQLSVRPSLE